MVDVGLAVHNLIRGRDNILYHGTSVQALVKILREGRFLPETYFAFSKNRLDEMLDEEERAALDASLSKDWADTVTLLGAYDFAKSCAQEHAFYDFLYHQERLAGVLKDSDFNWANFFNDGELDPREVRGLIQRASTFNFEDGEIYAKIGRALHYHGVVVGLHRMVFNIRNFSEFGIGEFDLVYPAEGKRGRLSAAYIHSICFGTPRDRELFYALYTP